MTLGHQHSTPLLLLRTILLSLSLFLIILLHLVSPTNSSWKDCREIKKANPSLTGSHNFTINPTNSSSLFDTTCEMSHDGGGWTYVANIVGSRPLTTLDMSSPWFIVLDDHAVSATEMLIMDRTGSPGSWWSPWRNVPVGKSLFYAATFDEFYTSLRFKLSNGSYITPSLLTFNRQYPAVASVKLNFPTSPTHRITQLTDQECVANSGYKDNKYLFDINVYLRQNFKCNSISEYDPAVCSGNGDCHDPGTCDCKQGYTGTNCELFSCFGTSEDESTVCSSSGTCSGPNTCSCNAGYVGENCETKTCFSRNETDSSVCSGHGSCTSVDTCSCKSGYTGYECQMNICFNINETEKEVCSGHGVCIGPDTCSCEIGYFGASCNETTCFSTNSTDLSVCSGHGDCSSLDSCVCFDGYVGNDCQIPECNNIAGNNSYVCSGNGECVSHNNCSCVDGYTGNICELPICFGFNSSNPSVCNEHRNGTCVAPDNCTCFDQMIDGVCQVLTCFGLTSNDPLVCNSRGSCYYPDKCLCDEGYGGVECDQNVCNEHLESESGMVCNGRGNCSLPNLCACQTGYSGSDCQYVLCHGWNHTDENVCSGNGNCSHPDMCVCNEGYSGADCSIPSCYGKNQSDNDACSSHGQCTMKDNCQCDEGYDGIECELAVCFNKSSSYLDVCSSHGTCDSPNYCTCVEGYSGLECAFPTCFNVNASDIVTVCGGHGECTDVNVCNCSNGWSGENCQVPVCFGVNGNDSLVCSQQGNCSAPDTCICRDGYLGTDCEYAICNGIPSNDSNACNGHGICSQPDVCDCDVGYSGVYCDVVSTCSGELVLAISKGYPDSLHLIDLSCEQSYASIALASQIGELNVYNGDYILLFANDTIFKVSLSNPTKPKKMDIVVPTLGIVFVKIDGNVVTLLYLTDSVVLTRIDISKNRQASRVISNYQVVSEYTSSQFIASSTDKLYMVLNVISGYQAIVEVDMKTVASPNEVLRLNSSTVIDGLIYLNELYVVIQGNVYRVQDSQLIQVFQLPHGITLSFQSGTEQYIYLGSEDGRILTFKKDTTLTDIPTYNITQTPTGLKQRLLSFLGQWKPSLASVTPDTMITTKSQQTIVVTGKDLMFGNRSSIQMSAVGSSLYISADIRLCDESTTCLVIDEVFNNHLLFANMSLKLSPAQDVPLIPASDTIVLYRNELLGVSATFAHFGKKIILSSPFYDERTDLQCLFHNMGQQAFEVVATMVSSESVSCLVPLFNNTVNEKIRVTVAANDMEYLSDISFDYLDLQFVKYYETFDEQTESLDRFDSFGSGLPDQLYFISYDRESSRSLVNMSSTFSFDIVERKGIISRERMTIQDQQGYAEFSIPSSNTANSFGRYLEVWLYASELNFVSTSLQKDSNGNTFISITYALGREHKQEILERCTFEQDAYYKLLVRIVRPEAQEEIESDLTNIEDRWVLEAQLIDMNTEVICSVKHVPDMTIEQFSALVLAANHSLVLSQQSPSTQGSSRSVRSLFETSENSGTQLFIMLDRIGLETQSGLSTEVGNGKVLPKSRSSNTWKIIVAIIIPLIGCCLLFGIIFTLAIIILVILRRKKNSDSWSQKQLERSKNHLETSTHTPEELQSA